MTDKNDRQKMSNTEMFNENRLCTFKKLVDCDP